MLIKYQALKRTWLKNEFKNRNTIPYNQRIFTRIFSASIRQKNNNIQPRPVKKNICEKKSVNVGDDWCLMKAKLHRWQKICSRWIGWEVLGRNCYLPERCTICVFALRFRAVETNVVIIAAFCEVLIWMGFLSVSIEDWSIKWTKGMCSKARLRGILGFSVVRSRSLSLGLV